jgi:hypothetical protein
LALREVAGERVHLGEAFHLEVMAYRGVEAMVEPAMVGFEHFFSCLCVDPSGSPLTRWMRVES